MNIKQAEAITGISRQNIRFYEKEGLISPERNSLNAYREYNPEDIHRLQIIKIMRKLGMTIEDTRKVLENKIDLKEALKLQQERLEQENRRLSAAIKLCEELSSQSIDTLDIDYCLKRIEEEEAKGSVFADFWNDFGKVAKAEFKKSFSFIPDVLIQSPREFTDELLKYAAENHDDITITKESMCPEFILNGIEYSACRVVGRMGAVVRCDMLHPELVEPNGINSRKYQIMKVLLWVLPITALFILILFFSFNALSKEEFWVKVLAALGSLSMLVATFGVYWKTRQ